MLGILFKIKTRKFENVILKKFSWTVSDLQNRETTSTVQLNSSPVRILICTEAKIASPSFLWQDFYGKIIKVRCKVYAYQMNDGQMTLCYER